MKYVLLAATLAVMAFTAPVANASVATFNFDSADGSLTSNNGVFTLNLGALGSIVFTGYQCNVLCSLFPSADQGLWPYGLSIANGGLGLSNGQGGELAVPATAYVLVDFSNFKGPLLSVTLNTNHVFDGWDIYQTNVPTELASDYTRHPVPIAQGNNNTDYTLAVYPNINSTIAQGATTGSSTFAPTEKYVTLTGLQAQCDGCPVVEIGSITITYPNGVPEPTPGLMVLAGGALLGLAFAGKKLAAGRQRSIR